MDFNSNQVAISHAGSPAIGATSDDDSGTLRVQSDNVRIYNLDIRNEFGTSRTDGQAVTLSEYGSKFGAYACRFFSYQVQISCIYMRIKCLFLAQDTLYANQGTQVYLQSYIEASPAIF